MLALLRQAGADGAEVERDLRRLLPLKTKAEYEPDDIAPSVASRAVERAQRWPMWLGEWHRRFEPPWV